MELFKILVLVPVAFAYSFIYSQSYPNGRVDSLLKAGISQIINQDYSGAAVFINSLNKEFPHLPLGKIYLAAIKIAEAYDYAEEFDDQFIVTNLESAKQQSEDLFEKNPDDIWYRYFYALSEGYLAYYDAINGSWLSAVSTGVNSISEFEKILGQDKKFYEAYIAIGTFEYWKSRKMEFIDWMPFTSDSRKNGIERLRIAIDSSSYNSYLAINSLIWIYIDQKDFDAAIRTAGNALIKYPGSRSFKWGMARAFEEIEPRTAIKLYAEILDSYPKWKKSNRINEITLKHLIAQQYVKLGDEKTALGLCNEILNTKDLSGYAREVLENRLERVEQLRNDLLN